VAVLCVGALWACGGSKSSAPTSTEPVVLPDVATLVVIDVDGQILVTAGGLVYRTTGIPDGAGGWRAPGAAPPAPPPPAALEVAELSPAGLAQVLGRLAELGLASEPPDYGDVGITDQDTFEMTITTSAGTFFHSVYARGEETGDGAADDSRQRLEDFVGFLGNLESELGDDMGGFAPFVPEQWSITADDFSRASGIPWPFSEPAVVGCTSFPEDEIAAGRTDGATGLYAVDGRPFAVEPLLPGEDCPT